MSTQTISEPKVNASAASNRTGYRNFTLGSFNFSRDEYFVHVTWPAKGQTMTVTMTKSGTIAYTCSIHPYMKGTITVQ